MTNDGWGQYMLRQWYRESGLDAGGTTFSDVISKWSSEHPTFVAGFGKVFADRLIDGDRVTRAMKEVAAKYPAQIPPVNAFWDALVSQGLTLTASDYADAAVKGVEQAGKIALGAAGIYLAVLAVGAAVILAPELRELFKKHAGGKA